MIFYTSGLLFRAEPGYSPLICIPETLTCPFSRVQSFWYETRTKPRSARETAEETPMKSRFVILALVLAQFGITAWGGEDPARFLAVKSWQGDFRHEVSGTYDDSGVGCTEVYTIGQSLFASGLILSNLVELDNLRYWESDSGVTRVQGSVTDKAEV